MDPKQTFIAGLEAFETEGLKAASALAKNSEALGRAALESVNITVQAAKDVGAGILDVQGATNVTRRAAEQLKHLAVAEGNLLATSLSGFIDVFGKVLLSFAPLLRL